MKVICKTNIPDLDNPHQKKLIKYDLTIGKVYEVHRYSTTWVYVIDDSGAKEHYHKYMFTPLVELRNEKIEELLK